MAGLVTTALTLATLGQVELPGTQPNELTLPPDPSSTCSCHDGYSPDDMYEPSQSYKATLMALGGRDPIFRAAFQVARRDRPELTDLCLRCHTPVGWLNGRSEGELDDLFAGDLESVTCDMCHRAVGTDPPLIGSGQFTIAPQTAKRSQRGSPPPNGHLVVQTDYTGSAQMCGTCHSLFNPAELAHGPDAQRLEGVYYEQRTYEEWRDSVFGQRNQTCIDCHMKKVRGAAARGGQEYDDLHVHSFVGGNDFAVQAVRVLNPNLPIAAEAAQVSRWTEENLQKAAEIEIRSPPVDVRSGDLFGVEVRLTNKTGHKLPTGYPEGRRVYLEVTVHLDGEEPVIVSGAWDQMSGNLLEDPQLRTYETEHGRVEDGVGVRTRHLILMNQIMTDTRIPPEGFMPAHEDMVPAGRDYGAQAPYRHWDDYTYQLEAPDVSEATTGTISVRAMHQSTDGEVIRFLVEGSAGTQESEDLQRAWDVLGHAPPKAMVRASIPILVAPRPVPPDAGVVDDAGAARDAGTPPPPPSDGCRCVGGGTGTSPWILLGLIAPIAAHRRRRGGGLRP